MPHPNTTNTPAGAESQNERLLRIETDLHRIVSNLRSQAMAADYCQDAVTVAASAILRAAARARAKRTRA